MSTTNIAEGDADPDQRWSGGEVPRNFPIREGDEMKILIAYATTDGQTRKIARFACDRLVDAGHGVELLSVDDAEGLDLNRFDGVILGGSLHAGHYQKSLTQFVTEAKVALAAKPTLLLAVSLLGAGDDSGQWTGSDKCLAEFMADTGWTPGRVEHVAGAFRFSEYDFRAWAMRQIADQKGDAVEAGKDKEYTDWVKMETVLDDWVAGIAA